MECIEARALKKSSFLSEFAVNSSEQVLIDDFLCVNGVSGVSGDDFSVDVFLDLSNGDVKDEFVCGEEESEEEEKDSLSTSSQERGKAGDEFYNSSNFSGIRDSSSLSAGDLSFPVDDLENLEWLSQFVDDSASESSLLCPAGNSVLKTGSNLVSRFDPAVQRTTSVLCFPSSVPAKSRTKRQRTGARSWAGSSPESSSASSPKSVSIYWIPVPDKVNFSEVVNPPPVKRQKKGAAEDDESGKGGPSHVPRRCSHCQVQKTPQWRNGPLGPKTLCNACGVRFKSGRLFPEYRPACSPTFYGALHSNSHRKVLEMRRKKEITGATDEHGRSLD